MKVADHGAEQLKFMCPGCRYHHHVRVRGDGEPRWEFNGDYTRPTLYPSVLVRTDRQVLCHSFVHAGTIEFLGDSAHALAGQTVELPELAEASEAAAP